MKFTTLIKTSAFLVGMASLSLGCAKSGNNSTSGGSITMSASFFKGVSATQGSTSGNFVKLDSAAISKATIRQDSMYPAGGEWFFTPDQMTLTITSIQLMDPTGQSHGSLASDCVVTFSKATPSLSKLMDCPLAIDAGTYTGISIVINDNIIMTIRDSTNGIYTDPNSPSLISTSLPQGGAQAVTINTCESCPANSTATLNSNFPSPIVIDGSGNSEILSVVFDPVQWLSIGLDNNGHFLGQPTSTGSGIPLIPTLGTLSKVEYYSSLNTLDNFYTSANVSPTGVKVYYTSASTPARVDIVFGGPTFHDALSADANCSANMQTVTAWPASNLDSQAGTGSTSDEYFGSGGNLGLDSKGILSWSAATDFSYQTMAGVFSMQEQTTLGATTTLKYECTQNVPAPVSGDTYASGAPAFTPTGTRSLTLIGH